MSSTASILLHRKLEVASCFLVQKFVQKLMCFAQSQKTFGKKMFKIRAKSVSRSFVNLRAVFSGKFPLAESNVVVK